MFNKGQLAGLMKQAQNVQNNVKKVQEELETLEVQGESGSGMVKITLTGKHAARRVTIDSSLLTEDKEMLEDLLVAAFNDAVNKVESISSEKMSKATAGMPGLGGGLPGGLKLPF